MATLIAHKITTAIGRFCENSCFLDNPKPKKEKLLAFNPILKPSPPSPPDLILISPATLSCNLRKIFPDEKSLYGSVVSRRRRKSQILSNLETMHVSCAYNSYFTALSDTDFVGLCIFHPEANRVFLDNGKRIKSGYIFTVAIEDLQDPTSTLSYHQQAYDMAFKNIRNVDGICIIGFSQQNGVFKGRSMTFNHSNATNLLQRSPGGEKECLFTYRTMIFGSLIKLRLTHLQNATPLEACEYLCLYLAVKQLGFSGYPFNVDLDHEKMYLKFIFGALGVDEWIILALFDPISFIESTFPTGKPEDLIGDETNSAGYGFKDAKWFKIRSGKPTGSGKKIYAMNCKDQSSRLAYLGILRKLDERLPKKEFKRLNVFLGKVMYDWVERQG